MNIYIISGIILIIVGTFLAVFGSILQGEKSASADFLSQQQQYENLAQKIDSLKQKRADHITTKQIAEIQKEFMEWIDSGSLEEGNKRHELQSKIVEMEQKHADLSEKWRHVYEYFYQVLETTLQEYNSAGITNAVYEIPELPSNLFSTEGSNYTVKVTFSTGKEWHIRHNVSNNQDSSTLPKIIFQFGEHGDSPMRFKLWITMILNVKQNRMRIKKAGPMVAVLEDIPSQISIRSYRYRSIFRELTRSLIEYELMRMQ